MMPHLALGTLTALAAGALGLSLATAEPIAPAQLHIAAAGTAAASTFAARETIVQSQGARVTRRQTPYEQYQAPDRIQVQQNGVITRVVGTRGYTSTDGGRTWTALPQPVDGASAIAVLKSPLEFLQRATDVTASDGQQRFTYTTTLSDFAAALNLAPPGSLPATTTPVTVTLSGEFVSTVVARFPLRGSLYTITLEYSQVDKLPGLEPPPLG